MSEGGRNLSGEFHKGTAGISRWLDRHAQEKPDRGLHALSKREKNSFFNQERIALAEKVFVSLNDELSEFGIRPFSFSQDIVDLFYYSSERAAFAGAINKPTYANADASGSLRLPFYPGLDNRRFVGVLLHEAGHFFSARIVKNNNWRQRLINRIYPLTFRRFGASMLDGKKRNYNMGYFLDRYIQIEPDKLVREKVRSQKVASGDEYFFLLNEGITERTARNIMKKYFPEFSSPSTKEIQSDFPWDPYEAMVICVDRMCESMVRHLPQTFKTSEDAFKLFQKATFGKGNWLPLARAIEKTWGIGSFKNFAEIMIFCDYFYSHMGGQPWVYAREAINNFITGKIKQ